MPDLAGWSVPVRWLASLPALGLTVLAGESQLDRPVSWAHSIELSDPGPWLRGGELMLTTGLRLPSNADGQRAYVRAVADAGVAAIGFGIGLSHDRVPPAVLAEAESLGLPVLEVPLPTPFVAVIRAVTERLAELQYEGVVRASRVQPRMTRAALRRGIGGVVGELARAVSGEVMLVGRSGEVLCASTRAPDPVLSAALAQLGLEASSDQLTGATAAGPWGVLSGQTVRVGGRVHGHVVVRTARRLEPADQLLVGHAASLIGLDLERPRRLHDEQSRLNSVVLSLLLDGAISGERAAEGFASAGMPLDDGVTAMVAVGPSPELVIGAADAELLPRGLPRVALTRGAEVVLVLPATGDDLPSAVLGAVPEQASGRVAVHAGTCTVGSVSEVARGARLAATAARSAEARGVPLVDAAHLGGYVLTADPSTRAVLSALAETVLHPLVEHDRAKGSDLVKTLRAFLDNHGQVEVAAAAVGVHRHTLRARMDRIRELLDVDLGSAHVRAELLLAMTGWHG